MKPINIERLKKNACPNCIFDWTYRSFEDLWRYRCKIGIDPDARFTNFCSLRDWYRCPLNKEAKQ